MLVGPLRRRFRAIDVQFAGFEQGMVPIHTKLELFYAGVLEFHGGH